MVRDVRDMVGRGLAFPLDVSSGGTVRWSVPLEGATDDDRRNAINQRVKHLILTLTGERVLYREYGTNVANTLFNLVQPAVVATVLRRMLEAIARWEPRVHVIDAGVEAWAEDGTVVFTVQWRLSDASLDGAATLPVGLAFKDTV